MKKILEKIKGLSLTSIGLIIGAYLIFDTCRIMTTGWGNTKLFSALFGCGLIAYIFLQRYFNGKNKFIATSLKALFIVFLVSFVIVEALLLSAVGKRAKDGDVLIVLGAALWKDYPSPILRLRLETAYDFLISNPQAICIVSGGQGHNEIISEAEAMSNYLVNKGIAEDRIIKEEKSINTVENFRYSKELIDQYFMDRPYKAVYVTTNFHVYRSGLMARDVGLIAHGLSAPNLLGLEVNYFLREYCSLMIYWIFPELAYWLRK